MKSQILLQPIFVLLLLSLPSSFSVTIPRAEAVETPLGVNAKQQSYIITLKSTEKRPWREITKSLGPAQESQPEKVVAKTIRTYSLKLSTAEALRIAKLPFIESVDANVPILFSEDKASKLLSRSPNPAIVARGALTEQKNAPWYMQRISTGKKLDKGADAKSLKYKYSYDPQTDVGAGVDVYLVDSGIDLKNPEFEGRAKSLWSYKQDNPGDERGHGTHVAGIIGSKTFGLAKKVNLISVKLLGAPKTKDGGPHSANLEEILTGVDTAIQNHIERKKQSNFIASIMNLSIGGNEVAALIRLVPLLLEAEKEGMHMVTSAGNDRANACKEYPAGYSVKVKSMMVVGNTDINDQLEEDSNMGICVSLFAPGTDILSIALGGQGKNGMISKTGTSMSSPMVVGVMAGQALKHKELRTDPHAMKAHMLKNMAKAGIQGYKDSQGPNLILSKGV
ncbi:Cerevisin [Arthrobotrys entomopaga]|nr:Cerevisin [Arthrobotrys entomopaga]